ncbi:phage shock protein G [Vibrio aerogenes CECT 7868]|uniref:Phage shock protein G n=1 Tax=Vibrio aerogenes CECT 7868 TaxID=1216006 RepID=A0A1M5YQG5_9VIBR|nr:envelope stress response protein PspG [Vibrio aerogenes]SHI14325.1 phage shock protein G [Vibrio aerogenes CECT 7868]
MYELLMLLVFVGTLAVMGVTIVSIGVAIGLSIVLMLFFGVLGMLFKWLPVLIVIAIVYYFVKKKS